MKYPLLATLVSVEKGREMSCFCEKLWEVSASFASEMRRNVSSKNVKEKTVPVQETSGKRLTNLKAPHTC